MSACTGSEQCCVVELYSVIPLESTILRTDEPGDVFIGGLLYVFNIYNIAAAGRIFDVLCVLPIPEGSKLLWSASKHWTFTTLAKFRTPNRWANKKTINLGEPWAIRNGRLNLRHATIRNYCPWL